MNRRFIIILLILLIFSNAVFSEETDIIDKVLFEIFDSKALIEDFNPFIIQKVLVCETEKIDNMLLNDLEKIFFNLPECLKKTNINVIKEIINNEKRSDILIPLLWKEIFSNPEALKKIKIDELSKLIELRKKRRRTYEMLEILAYNLMMKSKPLQDIYNQLYELTMKTGTFSLSSVDKSGYWSQKNKLMGSLSLNIDSRLSKDISVFLSGDGILKNKNSHNGLLKNKDARLSSAGIKYIFNENSFSKIGMQKIALKSKLISPASASGISYQRKTDKISSCFSYYKYDEDNTGEFNSDDPELMIAQLKFKPIQLKGEFYMFNDLPFNIKDLNTSIYAMKIDGLSYVDRGWYNGRGENPLMDRKYLGLSFSTEGLSKYSVFGEYSKQMLTGDNYYEGAETTGAEAFFAGMGIKTKGLGDLKISYYKYGDLFIKPDIFSESKSNSPGSSFFDIDSLYSNNYNKINVLIDKDISNHINIKGNFDFISNNNLLDISEIFDRKSSHIGLGIGYSLKKNTKIKLKYDALFTSYSHNKILIPSDDVLLKKYQNIVLEYSLPIM